MSDSDNKKRFNLIIDGSDSRLKDTARSFESVADDFYVIDNRDEEPLSEEKKQSKNPPRRRRFEDKSRYFNQIVGSSKKINEVKKLIHRVSLTDVTVMIMGESGTGKELAARAVHDLSSRASEPFIAVNCGAIPQELFESELFGHEKGAFTGAVKEAKGRLELAQGGTLFLDEIGDMPLDMQVKLLRVLQERTYERVGGDQSYPLNVRLITASHINLPDLIAHGKFRQDLFYRINVFPLEMPALRDRPQDIPDLLESHISQQGSDIDISFTPAALSCLLVYPWPGNARELANLVNRLSVLHSNKEVDVEDLPEEYRGYGFYARPGESGAEAVAEPTSPSYRPDPPSERQGAAITLRERLEQLEIEYLVAALELCDGVVARAARKLGIKRTTLIEKIRRFGIGAGE
ncbi:MAG: sigma-54 dependent transcriptional regulator [Pseudomonadales bacterium]